HKLCPTLGALALCFVGVAPARAQDPVQVAPNNFKVLLENDQMRVLDFHSKGEKVPMHSHPTYLTYDISGSGKTIYTSPDGMTSPGCALMVSVTGFDRPPIGCSSNCSSVP